MVKRLAAAGRFKPYPELMASFASDSEAGQRLCFAAAMYTIWFIENAKREPTNDEFAQILILSVQLLRHMDGDSENKGQRAAAR